MNRFGDRTRPRVPIPAPSPESRSAVVGLSPRALHSPPARNHRRGPSLSPRGPHASPRADSGVLAGIPLRPPTDSRFRDQCFSESVKDMRKDQSQSTDPCSPPKHRPTETPIIDWPSPLKSVSLLQLSQCPSPNSSSSTPTAPAAAIWCGSSSCRAWNSPSSTAAPPGISAATGWEWVQEKRVWRM